MKSYKTFIKNNVFELLTAIAFISLAFVLYGNYFLASFFSLLDFFLFLLLKIKIDEIYNDREKRISAYSFLASFLRGIQNQKSAKTSYEQAVRYLLSYQEIPLFEDILEENNLCLYQYQTYFNFLLEKEKENQVHLYNYSSLISSISETILHLEEKTTRQKKFFNIGRLFLVLYVFVIVMTSAFLKMENLYNNMFYLIGIVIFVAMILPLYYLFELNQIKENYYEKEAKI